MPGFTTHYLFGQQTYQTLDHLGLKKTIQKYHTVFSLGLQGPDIFFYDLLALLSPKKNPGSAAHTADTGKFLRLLLDGPRLFPSEAERQIAKAYIAGFIGHYLLDTVCHPYIYAMTHYNRHPKGYIGQHIRLETDIDTTLLWKRQHRRPSEFHQNESIALSREQQRVVSVLLYFAFSRTYPGLGITTHRIRQAIFAMQLGTRLLYDPSGRKKDRIRRLESIFPGYPILSSLIPCDNIIYSKDPCNLRHAPWKNPWDKKRTSTESFFDLFARAQDNYRQMLYEIDAFFAADYTPGEQKAAASRLFLRLGNLCYHSGLSSAPYV